MIEVPLSQGKVALIDDEDAELVARHHWFAHQSRPGACWYAVDYKGLRMHRLILGVARGIRLDHRNGDGLDNRRENLRIATPSQNAANMRPKGGRYSRFKGVTFDKRQGVWKGQIMQEGRNRFLGHFDDAEAAARAYDAAAVETFGEYARPNFPP